MATKRATEQDWKFKAARGGGFCIYYGRELVATVAPGRTKGGTLTNTLLICAAPMMHRALKECERVALAQNARTDGSQRMNTPLADLLAHHIAPAIDGCGRPKKQRAARAAQ